MRIFTTTRFERLLRLKNLEFYQLRFKNREDYAFLLFLDQESIENTKEDELDSIQIFLISHFEIEEEAYKDVISFNDSMLGMKPSRGYFMEQVYVKEEFDFDFPFGMDEIRKFIQDILNKVGMSLKLKQIENKQFNYLSQD